VVSMLITGPKIRGFKPSRGQWSFKDDKSLQQTSSGGKVKPRSHVVTFYGLLRNPASMKVILHKKNSAAISPRIFPASLLYVSAGNCERALVDASGMIKTQMGTHNR
jgi:hypothetical protein